TRARAGVLAPPPRRDGASSSSAQLRASTREGVVRISDVQRGKPTVLQVVPGAKDDFGPLPAMTEVEIFSSGLESEALLRVGKSTWKIEGANAHHQDLLSGVLVRALPRVAWVAAREPRDEKLAATSL